MASITIKQCRPKCHTQVTFVHSYETYGLTVLLQGRQLCHFQFCLPSDEVNSKGTCVQATLYL